MNLIALLKPGGLVTALALALSPTAFATQPENPDWWDSPVPFTTAVVNENCEDPATLGMPSSYKLCFQSFRLADSDYETTGDVLGEVFYEGTFDYTTRTNTYRGVTASVDLGNAVPVVEWETPEGFANPVWDDQMFMWVFPDGVEVQSIHDETGNGHSTFVTNVGDFTILSQTTLYPDASTVYSIQDENSDNPAYVNEPATDWLAEAGLLNVPSFFNEVVTRNATLGVYNTSNEPFIVSGITATTTPLNAEQMGVTLLEGVTQADAAPQSVLVTDPGEVTVEPGAYVEIPVSFTLPRVTSVRFNSEGITAFGNNITVSLTVNGRDYTTTEDYLYGLNTGSQEAVVLTNRQLNDTYAVECEDISLCQFGDQFISGNSSVSTPALGPVVVPEPEQPPAPQPEPEPVPEPTPTPNPEPPAYEPPVTDGSCETDLEAGWVDSCEEEPPVVEPPVEEPPATEPPVEEPPVVEEEQPEIVVEEPREETPAPQKLERTGADGVATGIAVGAGLLAVGGGVVLLVARRGAATRP